MNTVRTRCTHCSKLLRVSESHLTRSFLCPYCKQLFRAVPESEHIEPAKRPEWILANEPPREDVGDAPASPSVPAKRSHKTKLTPFETFLRRNAPAVADAWQWLKERPWLVAGTAGGFAVLMMLIAISSRMSAARIREQIAVSEQKATEAIDELKGSLSSLGEENQALHEKSSKSLQELRRLLLAVEAGQKKLIAAGGAEPHPATGRLADWEACEAIAFEQSWGDNLSQIPASVIDKGVLRRVPYLSFKAGDYEMNVYGDPREPCCVEIGLYRGLLRSPFAKQNCVRFIREVLTLPQDRLILSTLNLERDLQKRSGLTYEVTPESAEDAYGGWWLSVYDELAVEQARVAESDLPAITIKREVILVETKKPAPLPPATKNNTIVLHPWVASDLNHARPGVGSVYVRSYFRKDGTYVPAHTRSPPKKKKA